MRNIKSIPNEPAIYAGNNIHLRHVCDRQIPWAEMIGQFLALSTDTSTENPDDSLEIVVFETEFFKNLTRLLNSTEDTTLGMIVSFSYIFFK